MKKNKIKNKKVVFSIAVIGLLLILFLVFSIVSSKFVHNDQNPTMVINLNDNVKYYEVTSCGRYSSIENKCINKTIGELKNMYPKYNKLLDDLDYTNSDKLNSYEDLFEYFPDCFKTINGSTIKTLSKVEGLKVEFTEKFMNPYWLDFEDDKYSVLEWKVQNYTNYDLYHEALCEDNNGNGSGSNGNDTPSTYLILDEDKCKEYNLACDRW